jgi:hypothetical protein
MTGSSHLLLQVVIHCVNFVLGRVLCFVEAAVILLGVFVVIVDEVFIVLGSALSFKVWPLLARSTF